MAAIIFRAKNLPDSPLCVVAESILVLGFLFSFFFLVDGETRQNEKKEKKMEKEKREKRERKRKEGENEKME